jgi:hypothetical protein
MKPLLLNTGSFIQRAGYFGTAFIITAASLMTLMLTGSAQAAQITKRGLSISIAKPSATSVTYTIGASTGGSDTTSGFFFGTSHIVKAMKFQACTSAVGSCLGTAGTDIPDLSSAAGFTLTGWQDATSFTRDSTNQNDCDGTAQTTTICLSRSGASTPEDTTHSHKIVFTGITNPSTANTSFFIRMTTYTNATYTVGTITDTGTVASAVTQTLTVNAAVAEVLNFCVGSTTVNDATANPGNDCTNIGGSSLNIGTLDTSAVNVSPVSTNGGDNKNGVAMIRTNASSGATVSYDAIQQGGSNHTGTLRVSGATCNATDTDLTDQCIRAQGTSQATFTAGTERFGMTIGGVNCGSTGAYTCVYANGNTNLAPQSGYIGGSYTQGTSGSYGTGTGYAWQDSGASTIIASSASSPTKSIDDEALILRFAATPSITTPFGSYAAQTDFIAVPTY